jgi:hypothetical protein
MGKKYRILKDYDPNQLCGGIRLNGKGLELLESGEYIIAPAYIHKDNKVEIICFGLFHQSQLDTTPTLKGQETSCPNP